MAIDKVMSLNDASNYWLRGAIPRLQAKVKRVKIHDGEGVASFHGFVNVGADFVTARILYNYYLFFPAIGVGKGQPYNAVVHALQGRGRKKKRWLKELTHQKNQLGYFAGKAMMDNGKELMTKTMPTMAHIKLEL